MHIEIGEWTLNSTRQGIFDMTYRVDTYQATVCCSLPNWKYHWKIDGGEGFLFVAGSRYIGYQEDSDKPGIFVNLIAHVGGDERGSSNRSFWLESYWFRKWYLFYGVVVHLCIVLRMLSFISFWWS